jgi:hypothetical protein
VFSAAGLARLVTLHTSGRRDFSPTLWSLLMLEGFLARRNLAPPR